MMTWAIWFDQDPDKNGRRIALTEWTKFDRPTRLSTVFLGLNHSFTPNGPPIWFESCFFYGDDKYTAYTRVLNRYSDIEQAKAGHAELVEMINLIDDLTKIMRPELGDGDQG